MGELVSGNGVAPGTYVASILSGTSITLTSAATASNPTPLTFGTQSSYSGNTSLDTGALQAGSAYAFSPNSPFILANAAGANLDLNGFNGGVPSLSGGGSLGGNVLLTNGAVLTIGDGQSPAVGGLNQNAAVGNPFGSNTFAGQISGSGSLALTGGSTLFLTNTNNTYTGYTNILSGSLPITDMGELGNSTLPIVVMGSANAAQPLPNGQLILEGGSTGLTVNRNLDVGGYGTGQIGGNDGFSFVTIGNNTYNGIITAGANIDSVFMKRRASPPYRPVRCSTRVSRTTDSLMRARAICM